MIMFVRLKMEVVVVEAVDEGKDVLMNLLQWKKMFQEGTEGEGGEE